MANGGDNLRAAQERELAVAALDFDLAGALERVGRAFLGIFPGLGYDFCPRTFCVTYLAAVCSQHGLDGAQTILRFREDGVLDRIVGILEDAAAESA
jgi:hypothetical protein